MSQHHQRISPGYKKLENVEQRKEEAQQALEEITPTPQEKEVEGQKEEEKKADDLECELQLSPMDVDKVLVNGTELSKDSSLATLRAACSFLGISSSGSKLRSYTKILTYTKILSCNKKMELLSAKSLVSEAKAQETREVREEME